MVFMCLWKRPVVTGELHFKNPEETHNLGFLKCKGSISSDLLLQSGRCVSLKLRFALSGAMD